jgi:hypothetical protein
MAEKSGPGTRQTDSKNLVWFGELEGKLAKLSMPTFTYRSSSQLFYGANATKVVFALIQLGILANNLCADEIRYSRTGKLSYHMNRSIQQGITF